MEAVPQGLAPSEVGAWVAQLLLRGLPAPSGSPWALPPHPRSQALPGPRGGTSAPLSAAFTAHLSPGRPGGADEPSRALWVLRALDESVRGHKYLAVYTPGSQRAVCASLYACSLGTSQQEW